MLISIISDLKYTLRLLYKKPGFSLLTILVMATGLGLSVYLFSFINTMLFKSLPFDDGESIVQINASQNGVRITPTAGINLLDYKEIKNTLSGLSELTAYQILNLNVRDRDGTRRYSGVAVESTFFQVTRTKPLLGRDFNIADNNIGAEHVVIIGYDVWQNTFSGVTDVIDQKITINGESHRIIAVMPQGYYFPINTDMWIPFREQLGNTKRQNTSSVFGLAHINEDNSLQNINKQLGVIMQQLAVKFPKSNSAKGAYISTLKMSGNDDGALAVIYSLQIIALLLLILAAINVANLLLSRAAERGKETAIRVALGAPRSRIISQMLWESIIICCVAGIIGTMILAWGLEKTEATLTTFWFYKAPFWFKFGIDGFTIKLIVFFVLTTIFVTGLLPAIKNSNTDFNAVLRDGTRGALGKITSRQNRWLVICQIFVSMTVLIAAGIMSLANYNATRADYGANTRNTIIAKLILTESNYSSTSNKIQFVKKLQSRLENNDSITDVMIASALPGSYAAKATIALQGMEYSNNTESNYPTVNYITITTGSLAKLGIDLVSGRYFNNSDNNINNASVIVTTSFALRHYPLQTALGKRLKVINDEDQAENWLTIVGVVEHTKQGASYEYAAKLPSVFRPYTQQPSKSLQIALKSTSSKLFIIKTLRATLATIDPELAAFNIEPYADRIQRHSAPMVFITTIFLLFGIASAILASTGIYSLMSNTIYQRTHEIGIKRALGAKEQVITKEFLAIGFKQLLWGGIPGVIAGSAMGFAMSNKMGLSIIDILIVVFSLITIISAVVMLVSYLPTKQVLQMEPIESLRYE